MSKKDTKKEVKYEAAVRIPTATPYSYIEAVVKGSAQEIVAAYYEISTEYWKVQKARAAKKITS